MVVDSESKTTGEPAGRVEPSFNLIAFFDLIIFKSCLSVTDNGTIHLALALASSFSFLFISTKFYLGRFLDSSDIHG